MGDGESPSDGTTAGAHALGGLVAAVFDDSDGWTSDDLAGMWADLLDSRLLDLEGAAPPPAGPASGSDHTVRRVLYAPGASATTLGIVKAFAETAGYQRRALPMPIAGALYYLAIASAMTRGDAQLSSLNPGQLREGLRWVASRDWVDRQGTTLADRAAEVGVSDEA